MSQDKKDASTSKQGGQTQRIVAITGLVGAFAALFTAIGAPEFFPSLIKFFFGLTSSERSSEVDSSGSEEPSGWGSTSSVDTPSPTLLPTHTPASASAPSTSQTPTGKQDIKPIKLKIERVTVEDDNSYSFNYGPEKTIDNNHRNYWSTKNGAIIEVALKFFLEETSTVSDIHFISTRNNGVYTQPQSLNLAFINESGEKIEERNIQVKTPNTQWERNDFDSVANVSMIRLQLLDPLNDTGSYMTLNEVQFYGFPIKE